MKKMNTNGQMVGRSNGINRKQDVEQGRANVRCEDDEDDEEENLSQNKC